MENQNKNINKDLNKDINSNELLERIEILEHELQETANSFDTLIEILTEIATTDSVENMFKGLLSILNNRFHFIKSLFITYEHETFKVMANAGFKEDSITNKLTFKTSKQSNNSLAWCIYNLKSFMTIKNLFTDPRFNKDEFFEQDFAASAIAFYLEQDKISGVFIFYLELENSKYLRHISNNLDMLFSVLSPHLAKFVSHLQAVKDKQIIQEQLIQSGKLASLGMMVAGIAHELNNPLFAIMALAQNIQMKPQAEKVPLWAMQIVQSTERMDKVIKHLKIFSRKSDELSFKKINIHDPILEAHNLLAPLLKQENISIELKFKFATTISELKCFGDAVQLESVFQNLISNSKDAFENIKDNRKKQITIETQLQEDNIIKIIYIDNAGGMPQEIMDKIFDPFFTTKGVGKGTGLGMSLSYEIIKQHSGKIFVKSTVGEGTTFEIFLSCFL
ncbi:MAG: GHKL domain-containing protein [Oligoflexia bacterium]|nr:GHKL domain-containing protein [Oligoflexia bacterium]